MLVTFRSFQWGMRSLSLPGCGVTPSTWWWDLLTAWQGTTKWDWGCPFSELLKQHRPCHTLALTPVSSSRGERKVQLPLPFCC